MKALIPTTVTSLGLIFTTSVFAANVSGYQSFITSIHPDKTLSLPATAINVINLTEHSIYIVSPVDHEIPSGTARSVINHTYYGDTTIVLLDWQHHSQPFFDQPVCRHAIVSVSGDPSDYYTKVDTERCY